MNKFSSVVKHFYLSGYFLDQNTTNKKITYNRKDHLEPDLGLLGPNLGHTFFRGFSATRC